MPFSQLTYDHVIPKSRYKPNIKRATNWDNVVTACIKCNNTKGNRTPEEAGMKLKNNPTKPRYAEKYLRWYLDIPIIPGSETPTEWMNFIS